MKEVEKFQVKWPARNGGSIDDKSQIFDTKDLAKEFKKSLDEANKLLQNSPIDIRISPILVKVDKSPEPEPESEA